MKNKLKKVAGITAAAAGVAAVFGNVAYSVFLTRKGVEFCNEHMPPIDEATRDFYENNEEVKVGPDWYKQIETQKLVISADGGVNLHAVLIEPAEASDVYVISCHGYGGKPSDMSYYAKHFTEKGWNVIMPALNGHGENESDDISMGWHDREVILEWIKYITELYPKAKIVLHGVSMGAAAVMMTTGMRLPENVRCCIEDCGFTGVWDIFSIKFRDYLHLPVFPFLHFADLASRIRGNFSFKEASALKQVMKSVTPTLFIHGDKDTFVPFWMLHPLYTHAVCQKEKLVVPGAIHTACVYVDPELYWNTADAFIEKYI